jgi:anti-sigma factor RsiW
MNGLFQPCTRYRQSLCLLAGGVLPESEQDQLQAHLAGCAACRNYLAELESVTTPLTNWEKDFAHILPGAVARGRWAKAVTAAGRSARPGSARWVIQPTPILALREWCQAVIWPCRRQWAALALVWMMIFAGHYSLRDHSPFRALKSAPPSQALILAFQERQTILAELLTDHSASREADRPKSFSPKPRTERVRILTT